MSRAYYKRQFLNTEENGGMASVEADVGECSTGSYVTVDASLKISDCNRVVELDCNLYDLDSVENVLLKIRRLRSTIQQFEKALEAEADVFRKRKQE